ncbi:hypothetical protein [Roseomonas elaeocarpi]|uniref:Uncharacterized protein n=1 Tax=Roseomonas elaeocarpi TaxID=907779 RepID=A0ABV6JYZ3_9PROT
MLLKRFSHGRWFSGWLAACLDQGIEMKGIAFAVALLACQPISAWGSDAKDVSGNSNHPTFSLEQEIESMKIEQTVLDEIRFVIRPLAQEVYIGTLAAVCGFRDADWRERLVGNVLSRVSRIAEGQGRQQAGGATAIALAFGHGAIESAQWDAVSAFSGNRETACSGLNKNKLAELDTAASSPQ